MWRIQPLSKTEQLRRFGEALGDEARERQEQLAKSLWTCCGEPKAGDHHEACSKHPKELDQPALIAGQMSIA